MTPTTAAAAPRAEGSKPLRESKAQRAAADFLDRALAALDEAGTPHMVVRP